MLTRRYLLSLLFCLWLVNLSFLALADSFSDGVAAYKAHNYVRAAQLLQSFVRQNGNDPDAVFYLAMTYTHMNNYEAARQAFELVIQMVPPDHELAAKARNNISWLTKQQITQVSNSQKATKIMNASLSGNSQDNYLTHIIPGGKVIHFDTGRMPLKVYIADGSTVQGWNVGLKQSVIYAMQTWQNATHSRVRFTQVYNQGNADIIVRWQRNFTDNILGVSPFQTAGDTIIRSDINLAVCYPDSQRIINVDDLKAIAVHEMGHAIGIRGHSPYPDDIMYYSKTRKSNTLSQRDVNTIGMLYRLDADVRTSATSTAQTKQYYDFYDAGYRAQTNNRPAEAISYYRRALQLNPNLPEAKFNLGALLINEGNKLVRLNNLNAAKRNFEEAVRLYGEILQSPQPPAASRENYEIARTNLEVVNNAISTK
jgi:tetratricopeptide (TPR) repeat protein